jgi:adenylylsulfate kinase-like enzyme
VRDPDPRAVLLTGVYGTGKSSVAAEIADILEGRSVPYAALDLDWLAWFQAPGHEPHSDQRMLLANLRAVVDNYLGAGVGRFILAYSVRSRADLDEIRAVIPAPLTVVRLTVPLDEIERRLRSDVTAGRHDDLREAAAWLAGSVGAGLEDLAVANDRAIRDVALDVLARLGWG